MRLGINLHNLLLFIGVLFVFLGSSGCAEGPLWQTGKLSPWTRNQWAEEEKIANTFFGKKKMMNEAVAAVQNAPVEDQQKVALELANSLENDPILLTRLHAIRLLGQLDCPASIDALVKGSHDHNSEIRIASIQSFEKMPAESAIPNLHEIIGSDTNTDVRLAATRSLGHFSGLRAVSALALALNDSDPALQLRAAESLQQVTGEQMGPDIQAWQKYVIDVAPPRRQPLDDELDSRSNAAIVGIPAKNRDNDFQSSTNQQTGNRYQ